jgi:hypothetical protein
MSRSNPQDTQLPNPATRWLTFNGSTGKVRYFDKELKETVVIDYPFTFILLDVLACVKGYDETAECDIFSNEVKNLQKEQLTVRSRTGGIIATGFYGDIKKDVNAAGAEFHSNLYIAIKTEAGLRIASLKLKGAAVSSWMEFEKKNRAQLYEQAIVINGSDEHTNGAITYKTPKFTLMPLSAETQAQAKVLDIELQTYLKSVSPKAAPPVEPVQHLRDEDVVTTPKQPEFDDVVPF